MRYLTLHKQLDDVSLKASLSLLAIIDGNVEDKKVDINDKGLREILKTMTCRWLLLDEELKKMMETVKSCKEEKMQLEKKILDFMNKNDQDEIEVREGKLSKADKESKEPLNEEYIKRCIIDKTNNTSLADELAKIIMDNRNKELEHKLKNTTGKGVVRKRLGKK